MNNNRYPVALLTHEDVVIWHKVDRRFDPSAEHFLHRVYIADRRDADLMLFQMKLRDKLKPRGNYVRWMDLYPEASI